MKLPLKKIGQDYAMCLMGQYHYANINAVNEINNWLGRVPNSEDRRKAESFFHYWNDLHQYYPIGRLDFKQRNRISLHAQNFAREIRDEIFSRTTYQDWGY